MCLWRREREGGREAEGRRRGEDRSTGLPARYLSSQHGRIEVSGVCVSVCGWRGGVDKAVTHKLSRVTVWPRLLITPILIIFDDNDTVLKDKYFRSLWHFIVKETLKTAADCRTYRCDKKWISSSKDPNWDHYWGRLWWMSSDVSVLGEINCMFGSSISRQEGPRCDSLLHKFGGVFKRQTRINQPLFGWLDHRFSRVQNTPLHMWECVAFQGLNSPSKCRLDSVRHLRIGLMFSYDLYLII